MAQKVIVHVQGDTKVYATRVQQNVDTKFNLPFYCFWWP